MRPRPAAVLRASAVWVLAWLAGVLGPAAPARAWTDARLTGADAHVDVWASGQALVRLALELEVRAGYLSSFELSGLDPDLVLDADKPPSLLREDGSKARPQAQMRADGTLALSFARASAPRRGHHRLEIGYAVQLATTELPAGRRRVSFALPAWRADLEDVDLWISAPPGTTLSRAAAGAPEFERWRAPLSPDSRTVLHLHRAHLPRALSAGAELELPIPVETPQVRSLVSSAAALGQRAPLWLALGVLLLVWLKRRALSAMAARNGTALVPLVTLPRGLRTALLCLLTLAGALLYPRLPLAGLALLCGVIALGLVRPAALPAPSLGAVATSRTAQLFSAASWLDATAPTGFSLLASAYAIALSAAVLSASVGPGLELLIVCTPLFLTGTRLHFAAARHTASAAPPPNHGAAAETLPPTEPLRPRAGAALRAPDRAA